MLLPYRVIVSDTKVTHFTPISALCTCLYRLHLRKPVSMKQTKHSRKSEAQKLCSKCPPFTLTRSNDYATAQSLVASVTLSSLGGKLVLRSCTSWNQVNGDYYRNTVLLNMLLLNIRSVFGVYYVFQQDGAPAHRARDTVTMLQRETPEFIPPEMWPPNLPDLNPVDYSICMGYASTEGLPLVDPWCELKERWKLKERLLREWRLLEHAHRHRGRDCAVA